jgi:predicted transcriptional regulator
VTVALFARGSATSQLAAMSIREQLPRLQGEVFIVISCAGARGLTTDEIERLTGLKHQTASARVYELHKKKLIVDSGQRRPTGSGRMAVVYVATEGA